MDADEKQDHDGSPERTSLPIKSIPANKIQAFEHGYNKKTPFQIHKENAEMKKKRDDEEAAKVYEEFVASFDDQKQRGLQFFVPAQKSANPSPSIPPGQPKPVSEHPSPAFKSSSPPVPSNSTSTYKPMSFVKAGQAPKTSAVASLTAKHLNQADEDDDEEEDALAQKLAKSQKKRNLDTFLEEIKKQQEDREHVLRARTDNYRFSGTAQDPNASSSVMEDVNDMMTTNLYISNISSKVDEVSLCREFAAHGPIASVKIMWPRTQEERERHRNCGFVSFMKRQDAEKALRALDGKDVEGHVLKVGWGKAVALPDKPYFVLDKDTAQEKAPKTEDTMAPAVPEYSHYITVTIPTDIGQLRIIHRVIERVLVHGAQFEIQIMRQEQRNPLYRFLSDPHCAEHVYYRWRLYSLLQGDTVTRWRTEAFQMISGGPWWVPPEAPFDDDGSRDVFYDTDDERREKAGKGKLGKISLYRFESMLRQVTFQRGTIAQAMAFAIDHADAADEVIGIVVKSLSSPDTTVSAKLARLYVVSDILHNSSTHVPDAWRYRSGFEARLPDIFEHFNTVYRSINARLKAEQVRRHVCAVLHVWENWMVFPLHYIQHLNEIFMRKTPTLLQETLETSDTSSIQPTPSTYQERFENTDKALAKDSHQEAPEESGEFDGEPMSDVDGEPMTESEEEEDEDSYDKEMEEDVEPEESDEEIEDMFAIA